MKNNKGFTLTEVLLAALIVGVMGMALAALTTSATREGGTGRTKMVLRNQLSGALRQLRQDIHGATSISFPSGKLIQIEQDSAYRAGPDSDTNTIVYQLVTTGASSTGVVPAGSTIGNKITRTVGSTTKTWLSNVKVISSPQYPKFALTDTAEAVNAIKGINSVLEVDIIVEVPGKPAVNEVVHETFLLPHGIDVTYSSAE